MTSPNRAGARTALLGIAACAIVLLAAPPGARAGAVAIGLSGAALAQTTTRVSVSSSGAQGNNISYGPSISADGRYVAYYSYASNLVPGDTNGATDIFVHDSQTGTTTRVSVSSGGTQANSVSYYPSISADGRFVAFESFGSNLVPGDTNGSTDIFVHDSQTGTTTRVSVSSSGMQGNGESRLASLSADGRFVAFYSIASNLVPGDTNGFADAFVHDRQTGTTTRVSVASDGTQGNNGSGSSACSISADGRFVALASSASNLVPGDTNGFADAFVHDRQTGQTTRVSVASTGEQGNGLSRFPSISTDGRFVAFESFASNLVPGDTNGAWDAFVHDRLTGTTTRVSVASDGTQGNNSTSGYPCPISADGRFVAFQSDATNLVPGDTNGVPDIFVRDRGAPCPGDANGDGVVNFADLNLVLANFGMVGPNILGDVNGDGVVNFADLNIVLAFFGTSC